MTVLVLALLVVAGGTLLGTIAGRQLARQRVPDAESMASADLARLRKDAELQVARVRKEGELTARDLTLTAERDAENDLTLLRETIAASEQRCAELTERLAEKEPLIIERDSALRARSEAVRRIEQTMRRVFGDARALETSLRERIETIAGESALRVRDRIADGWIEETRSLCAAQLRTLDQGAQDPEYTKQAKRILGISIQRYEGHYLTERLLSNLPLLPGTVEQVIGPGESHLRAIEEVAGIKLTLAETGDSIRLEGLDGVGREVARRAIARLAKGIAQGVEQDPLGYVRTIKQNLEREIQDLGRRAFSELQIPRAHAEIVDLVGRLNYRTSYTQNQWKHAVEAAFLCGMMASELRLDVKLARRAALLHDIGKALTHEIDGSHAVIGADYARRLGESELVANAIGAHHADEPPGSPYAFLVAAGDAMSGARPGARREMADNYVGRIHDLERLAARFRGVERAYPVQAGREVRVYVREHEVSDEAAVALSSEIARKISDELTFPGQIKVTVVREVRAVEIAS